MFIETRRECLKEIKEKVCTSNGVEVVDVVRFFYGDGPAAQFEAGHKQGQRHIAVLVVGQRVGASAILHTVTVHRSYP